MFARLSENELNMLSRCSGVGIADKELGKDTRGSIYCPFANYGRTLLRDVCETHTETAVYQSPLRGFNVRVGKCSLRLAVCCLVSCLLYTS
ncbi:MAG: hypothetical protein MPK62_11360, partial [Alphaproteobacteria bacterium]|nr:hypothetical protein [Alphaproteobacteria bacterium]